MARGSTLMGLQLAPQQTARPGAGPLPPFSWFLSGKERSLQDRGAGAQRTQYADLPCTCLQFKARGMGWVHRSQKDTQAGDLGAHGHMGLWACC